MPNSNKKAEIGTLFHQAYEEHSDALFRFSFSKLSDREKALDVVQDVYVRYWEYMAANGQVDNIKAFLYKIARNAIIDIYRKRKESSLDALAEEGIEFPDPVDHEHAIRQADAKIAVGLVRRLGEDDQEIILMRYTEGLSVKEIAEILDERENTVSVRIHRALKQLQDAFNKKS